MAQSIATSDHAQRIANAVLSGLRSTTDRVTRVMSSSLKDARDRLDSRIVAEIDVDKVATELDVAARGASDGSAGQPPALEQEATGVQREVVAHFRGLQRRALKKATVATDRLTELGNKVEVERAIAEIREIPARCESDLLRQASKWRPDVERACEEAAMQYQDIDDEDGNTVAVPAQGKSVFLFAMLAVLAILGTAFLLTNLAVQGVAVPENWSLAIAALVVLAPFVIAREIHRYAEAERLQHRIMAGLGTILSVVFVIVLAVFAAAFVSASLAGTNPGVQDVLNTFATPTIGIDLAPQGWVAASAAIVAGMLAIGLGKNSAEPAQARRVPVNAAKRSADPVQAIRSRIRKQYNRLVDQADRRLSAEADGARKRAQRYSRALDDAASVPGEIEDYFVVLEDACNIVLDRYRAANRETRSEDDPPSFGSHVCFRPDDESYRAAFERAEGRREEFRQALSELERETAKARQKLRDLNGRALQAVDGNGFGSARDDDLI